MATGWVSKAGALRWTCRLPCPGSKPTRAARRPGDFGGLVNGSTLIGRFVDWSHARSLDGFVRTEMEQDTTFRSWVCQPLRSGGLLLCFVIASVMGARKSFSFVFVARGVAAESQSCITAELDSSCLLRVRDIFWAFCPVFAEREAIVVDLSVRNLTDTAGRVVLGRGHGGGRCLPWAARRM